MLLVVMPQCQEPPVASLFLVLRMLLVVMPGAPSSVLARSSDALCSS